MVPDEDGPSTNRPSDARQTAGGWSGQSDPTAYRTSDALAEDVFASMRTIEASYQPGQFTPELLVAADRLVRSCMTLLATGPPQYRVEVTRLLPLTQLELDLLGPGNLKANTRAYHDLVARLGEWITRSPMSVDERSVHVAEFLRRLWPSLGLWDDRVEVDAMVDRSINSGSRDD